MNGLMLEDLEKTKQTKNKTVIEYIYFYSNSYKPGRPITTLANITSGTPYMHVKSGIQEENHLLLLSSACVMSETPHLGWRLSEKTVLSSILLNLMLQW